MSFVTAVNDDRFIAFLRAHPLFAVGLMLLAGYMLARAAGAIRLPEITGFILAGLAMGTGGLAILGKGASEELAVVTEVALGIIALTIGGELRLAKLKRVYRAVGWITAGQFVLTFAGVSVVLILLSFPPPFALLLGAVATTTSPAAVIAIVQSMRVRGKFVDHLHGTVALGDAASIAVFGIILAMVPVMLGTASSADGLIWRAIGDLAISVVLGAVIGFLVFVTTRRQPNPGEVMILTLGFLFLSTALAVSLGFSPLLMNMAAGAAIANLSAGSTRIFRTLEPLTPPVYALFFVIAGTKLNPTLLFSPDVLVLGGAFVAARWVGKYFGSYIGAALGGSEPGIRRWIGAGLFAQAGVALGLMLLLQAAAELDQIPGLSLEVVRTATNVVLLSIFVNEITGPPIAKVAITRALELEE
jgi:Kef-type K+ transport system membrane component KefB